MAALEPALAVGGLWMVNNMVSLTIPEIPVAVIVRSTEPDEISEAPGVYKGLSRAGSLKVPLPAVVHATDE
jgi:hypothetical protein